jgi:hypothetical protein
MVIGKVAIRQFLKLVQSKHKADAFELKDRKKVDPSLCGTGEALVEEGEADTLAKENHRPGHLRPRRRRGRMTSE